VADGRAVEAGDTLARRPQAAIVRGPDDAAADIAADAAASAATSASETGLIAPS
jgi:hypothetical protein